MRRILRLPVTGLLLLFFCTNAMAQTGSVTIQEIQRAIHAKGLAWTAGATGVSQRTAAERQTMLGGLRMPFGTPERPRLNEGPLAPQSLPASFDWGHRGGLNWMTPIRDQGQCGSCWGFAAVGVYESKEKIRTNQPSLEIDLSEENMVSCWGGGCITGETMPWTLAQFTAQGTCYEACFPYTSGDGSVPSCSNRCPNPILRFVNSWGWWSWPDPTVIKTEIMTHGPVTAWMNVYEDFWYYTGGVYSYAWGPSEGGHFVVLYGWDDSNNCWLARNSWGTYWGELGPDGNGGWCRIAIGSNGAGLGSEIHWMDLGPSLPALPGYGMTILAALLLGAGILMIRRRKTAASASC